MTARARRIVVGYDGSDAAQRALDAAADLLGYGSTLAVVSVLSNGAPDTRAATDQARAHLLGRHISALYVEQLGEPADAIARAARALDADLIVVGRTNERPPGARSEPVSAGVLREASWDGARCAVGERASA